MLVNETVYIRISLYLSMFECGCEKGLEMKIQKNGNEKVEISKVRIPGCSKDFLAVMKSVMLKFGHFFGDFGSLGGSKREQDSFVVTCNVNK